MDADAAFAERPAIAATPIEAMNLSLPLPAIEAANPPQSRPLGVDCDQRLVGLPDDSPLLALDRLNSWQRADQHELWRLQSEFKEIIYWTKRHAILAAAKEMEVQFERLVVPAKCRSCNGTGTWFSNHDYNSQWPEKCRGCDATGTAKLRFIGSTIGPIRWHTPRHKWRSGSMDHYLGLPEGWCEADENFKLAEGWNVNKPGKPMTAAEVERDMLAILRAYPKDVAFAIDFHYHAKIMPQWNFPDIRKAEKWLREKFSEANAASEPQPPENQKR